MVEELARETSVREGVVFTPEQHARWEVLWEKARKLGALPAGRADADRLQCDAAIASPDKRNAATIPPRMRRAVLARDRHRCRAPGCGRTRFLEIHHVLPRMRGGTNATDNLITLCSACHRLHHERGPARGTRGI